VPPFGPNSPTDFSGIVNMLQQGNTILTAILNALNGGVAIQPKSQVFLVAALPTVGVSNGQIAFASNARKVGEGVGAGTGLPVYYNAATSQWFTYANALVTA
jgi:hypothetical protein